MVMNSKRKRLLVFGFIREYCQHDGNKIFLPNDVIQLFNAWLTFTDYFDKNKSNSEILIERITDNKQLQYQKITIKDVISDIFSYATAIGNTVIAKGQKYLWKFQMLTEARNTDILIGIIDTNMFKQNDEVDDFTNASWKGYGLYLYSMLKYHASQNEHDGTFYYGEQFNYSNNDIISMELDLTQTKSKCGILRFDTSATEKETLTEFNRISDNVLYSNVDINKQYHMAVAIQRSYAEGIALLITDC
eukprot:133587_1